MNLLILLSCKQALQRMDDYIDREVAEYRSGVAQLPLVDAASTDGSSMDGSSTDGSSTDGSSTDGSKEREASLREARWVRAHLALCHACAQRFAFEIQFTLALREKLDQLDSHLSESRGLGQGQFGLHDSLPSPDLAARISAAIRRPPGQGAGHSSERGA